MANKLIRDTIHGYIEIPEIIINELIDTPVFQRLRQIEQTSMRTLYPSAHHDRFVHSLGVYHLGKLAFSGLIHNILKKDIYENNKKFWERYGKCFELACLLHDCGHAPMSHSFEYGYLNYKDENDCLEKKKRLLTSMIDNIDQSAENGRKIIEQTEFDLNEYFKIPKKIAPHEMVSAILVSEVYGKSGKIKKILDSLLETIISENEIDEYIIFMQRAIIGLPYSSSGDESTSQYLENCFKNCLISLLNGNFFDVDKLDYIVRDTAEAGASNITIDIPRILNSLTLVEIHSFEKETEVESLELNNSVYFTGCESELFDRSENSDCECALELYDAELKGKFQGTLHFGGGNNRIKVIDDEEDYQIGNGKKNFSSLTEIEVKIENSCKMIGRYNGQIELLGHSKESKIDGTINAKISGKLKGKIIGFINTSAENKLTYEVGYKKTSLSVIEDTLIARNRLYLWIYAHHKVTYNDYLLRRGILRSFLNSSDSAMGELEKNQASNSALSNIMNIDNIFFEKNQSPYYLLCDGDLICEMKKNAICNIEENSFAEDWISRKHMFAVWKSYVEYNNFFSNLNLKQRQKLWKLLFNGNNNIDELPSEANTKEFENSILNQYSSEINYTWIKPSGIKLKEMDTSNIYIVLSDSSVKRLKDVILQSKVTEQYADESFFYLYTSRKMEPDEKLQLISFLKKKVKQL
ncbi:MAG: HD domain-containing protein [Lachnospiraceae bacterium]|nr:HD domain-containing protein [Lachnospiraceae bacterium]